MCVGCSKRPAFVCNDCALPCAWCNDIGPYCTECSNCKGPNHEYGAPGHHECERCERRIKLGEPKAKRDVCDEFYYHIRCLVKCECDRKDVHYLCKDAHECEGDHLTKKGYGCAGVTCKRGRVESLLPGHYHKVCPDHKRVVRQRVAELNEKWNTDE